MKNLFAFLLIFLALSCNSTKQTTADTLVMSMEKTGCMGSCPEYTLEVYQNGTALLKAEENLDKKGNYQAKLSKEKLEELVRKFDENNFFKFEDKYTSHMSDLPTTFLYFSHNGQSHRVEDYDNAPESLKDLEKEMSGLLTELDWKKVN